MIPKLLHRTTKCFQKLQGTPMGEYRAIWESMGVEVREYTDEQVDRYMMRFLEGEDLRAYQNLVSMTFRTDIWRLCVLYQEGGIYTDVHVKPMTMLTALFESDIEHVFVIDSLSSLRRGYNAVMMAKPGSELIWSVLQRALLHIRERVYTRNILDITGPGVLGFVLRRSLNSLHRLIEGVYRFGEGKLLLFTHTIGSSGEAIIYNDQVVFECRYPKYREDMKSMGCDLRYETYCYHRMLYKEDFDAVKELLSTGRYSKGTPISVERIKIERQMMEEYEV